MFFIKESGHDPVHYLLSLEKGLGVLALHRGLVGDPEGAPDEFILEKIWVMKKSEGNFFSR